MTRTMKPATIMDTEKHTAVTPPPPPPPLLDDLLLDDRGVSMSEADADASPPRLASSGACSPCPRDATPAPIFSA
jgi:hypothetical protein